MPHTGRPLFSYIPYAVDKRGFKTYNETAYSMRTVRLHHPVLKQNQGCFCLRFYVDRKPCSEQGFFYEVTMYYISSEATFDGAHFLKNYEGKCHNLHGHRWLVRAHAKAEALKETRQEKGMLTDFGNLKKSLKEACDFFDHALIYEKGSLKDTTLACLEEEDFLLREVSFRPTAENLSKYFYDLLKNDCPELCRVEVYETPTNKAAYEE